VIRIDRLFDSEQSAIQAVSDIIMADVAFVSLARTKEPETYPGKTRVVVNVHDERARMDTIGFLESYGGYHPVFHPNKR